MRQIIAATTLTRQRSEVEGFMIREMQCGSSLEKLERFEKVWSEWKSANGFHHAHDCEAVANEIHAKLEQI